MMSREEAKQEMKEAEGNLEVKGKMKARMREIAKRRMLANVPNADLVVMNPTHYAVALKYDDATMAASRACVSSAVRRSVTSRVKHWLCAKRPCSQSALESTSTCRIEPSRQRIRAAYSDTRSPRWSRARMSSIAASRTNSAMRRPMYSPRA